MTTARDYQLRGTRAILDNSRWMLAWWMGVGKSKAVVDAVVEADMRRVLILAPLTVCKVWPAEFAKWAPHWWGRIHVFDSGPIARRAQNLAVELDWPMALRHPGPLVVILNYEAAWRWPLGEQTIPGTRIRKPGLLLGVQWDMVVLDESHHIKAPGGIASRFVAKLARTAARRVCLTGTPMPHSPDDVWAQARFLDDTIFGRSFTRFRHEWPFTSAVKLDADGTGFLVSGDYRLTKLLHDAPIRRKWYAGAWHIPFDRDSILNVLKIYAGQPAEATATFEAACDALAVLDGFARLAIVNHSALRERFAARLATFMDRVSLDEALPDLPEVLPPSVVPVTLGDKAAKVYRDLERHLVAEVAGGTVTAANGLAKLLRLQQVTSGWAAVGDPDEPWTGTELVRVDDGKAEALRTILDGLPLDEPVVVFCRFVGDLRTVRDITAACERKSAELSGAIKNVGARWEPNGGAVLAVQVRAGGEGVDFSAARYAVWYSLGFSLGEYDQCHARLHRHGQTRPVVRMHLVAAGTVDEAVHRAIEGKRQVVESVLAELSGKEKVQ